MASSAEASSAYSLAVSVNSVNEAHPQIDTNESYSLDVGADGATLHAATVYGALHGLETFSQLVVHASPPLLGTGAPFFYETRRPNPLFVEAASCRELRL